ncbi:MAG TPA: NAD-dependent malic enzyme, partial [Nitrospiraceae bacterium]|nr:NAD-dependent malic enzyme [Nitrospiraceae bacterium]
MNDLGPYSNYRLTVRLELANIPGMFAKVAAILAEEGANLGAVDVVSATADRMVPDVTFDVQNKLPLTTRNLLSMIYTPGVGRVVQAIAKDKTKAYAFTIKSNT